MYCEGKKRRRHFIEGGEKFFPTSLQIKSAQESWVKIQVWVRQANPLF